MMNVSGNSRILQQCWRSTYGQRWLSSPSIRTPHRYSPSPRASSTVRFLSEDAFSLSEPQTLFLWLGDATERADITAIKPSILFPPEAKQQLRENTCQIVTTIDEIVHAVDQHYQAEDASEQFVGGMGEQDLGVWFAPLPLKNKLNDPLLFSQLIRDGIEAVKEHRHGVPFGLYTTACILDQEVPSAELEVDTFEVSLFGSNQKQYNHCTGRKDFNTVCSFIGLTLEQGIRLDASVTKEYASAARSFAKALGVSRVHVYK
jgi:hypothetical protein